MVVTDIYAAGEEYTPEAARDLMAVIRSDNNITALGKKREDVMEEVRLLGGLCNSAEFDASTSKLLTAIMSSSSLTKCSAYAYSRAQDQRRRYRPGRASPFGKSRIRSTTATGLEKDFRNRFQQQEQIHDSHHGSGQPSSKQQLSVSSCTIPMWPPITDIHRLLMIKGARQ